MSRYKAVVIVSLLALSLASASWATTKFNCNFGGRSWNITPGMSPIEITVMVARPGTDCDIVVSDPASDTIVALGLGVESRYETVRFGPLPGVPVTIIAIKASGPNSAAYLRASDSLRFLRGRDGAGLRYLGTLEELASRDAHYARVLEKVRHYQRLKAARRARE